MTGKRPRLLADDTSVRPLRPLANLQRGVGIAQIALGGAMLFLWTWQQGWLPLGDFPLPRDWSVWACAVLAFSWISGWLFEQFYKGWIENSSSE